VHCAQCLCQVRPLHQYRLMRLSFPRPLHHCRLLRPSYLRPLLGCAHAGSRRPPRSRLCCTPRASNRPPLVEAWAARGLPKDLTRGSSPRGFQSSRRAAPPTPSFLTPGWVVCGAVQHEERLPIWDRNVVQRGEGVSGLCGLCGQWSL